MELPAASQIERLLAHDAIVRRVGQQVV
jgi:hypothetical protein